MIRKKLISKTLNTTTIHPQTYSSKKCTCMPFLEKISLKIARVLKSVGLKLSFYTTNSSKSIFSHPKDLIPQEEKKNVQFTSAVLNLWYMYHQWYASSLQVVRGAIGKTVKSVYTVHTFHRSLYRNQEAKSNAYIFAHLNKMNLELQGSMSICSNYSQKSWL